MQRGEEGLAVRLFGKLFLGISGELVQVKGRGTYRRQGTFWRRSYFSAGLSRRETMVCFVPGTSSCTGTAFTYSAKRGFHSRYQLEGSRYLDFGYLIRNSLFYPTSMIRAALQF